MIAPASWTDAVPADAVPAQIVSVADGDTIHVRIDNPDYSSHGHGFMAPTGQIRCNGDIDFFATSMTNDATDDAWGESGTERIGQDAARTG